MKTVSDDSVDNAGLGGGEGGERLDRRGTNRVGSSAEDEVEEGGTDRYPD